ncbi:MULTISPECIES: autotransporter domain-containing protein [unclassified Beijerinckia]|uniref:autotransporter domain-containing protein n=1 Tax=unclassified Beijerinckia TaxID=2638183 RepID=UPI000B89B96F|nr:MULTISPECIES: autotransporter domain-containing protein [unclassified Beijerinckia]
MFGWQVSRLGIAMPRRNGAFLSGVSVMTLLLASSLGIVLTSGSAIGQEILYSGGRGGNGTPDAGGIVGGGGGGGGFGPGGSADINPGQSGSATDGGSSGSGNAGGAGGGTVSNSTPLAQGYVGGNGVTSLSGGGGGGTGLVLTGNGSTDTNGRTITGGVGGGVIAASSGRGSGGGGTGLLAQDGRNVLINSSTISGGDGGNGDFTNPNNFSHGGGGGAGIFLQSGGSISNVSGNVQGGNGGYGSFGGDGGDGGAGILANNGSIENAGIITGGVGGSTAYIQFPQLAGRSGVGGAGIEAWGTTITNMASGQITGGMGGANIYAGVGGDGVMLRSGAPSVLTNNGSITGGVGAQSYGFGGVDGQAAAGGAGVSLATGSVLDNEAGVITGGRGGYAFAGTSGGFAGAGGAGVRLGGGTVNNSSSITGGNGGVADGSLGNTLGRSGGNGGSGIDATGGTINNRTNGTITGGDGGIAGTEVAGIGGAGVRASGATINNDGAITGGIGGAANGAVEAGAGGTGISGANLTIINSGTIIGGMSGDGAVQADAITFTGGANKLTIGTAVADINGAIAINGGSLTLDQSANNTEIFSDIIGIGSVEKTGTATVLLSGINTYSGGTTVTQGILDLDGPQPLGTGTVTMNGGTLRVATTGCGCGGSVIDLLNDVVINAAGGTFDAASGVMVLLGNITDGNGRGTLTITGDGGEFGGFVVFLGNNTYSGPTHITANGILLAGSETALSANSDYIVDGILDMGGFNTTVRSLSGASTGQVGSSGFGNPVTLTLNATSGTSTYNGIILDGGSDPVSVVKTGAGKQVLAGINTYTGSTTVNAGILSIDGSIASSSEVIVNSGGTLSGNGIVSTTTINAGGTLAPGNSIGTLTVQGNLTFMAGSAYQVEVSPSNADRVNVTGIATLNGATLSAFYEPGAYVTKRHTVLNAAGGVNGTFSGPVNTNLPTNFSTALNYDNNNAYLDLTLNYVPPGPPYFGNGLTVNQANVATALVNSFNTAGGIPLVLGGLTAGGLTQASGESATGLQQATFNVMDRFLNLMTDPYASGRTTAMLPMSYAPLPRGTQPLMVTQQQRWSVWAAGYGSTQTTRGNAFVGSNTNTAGIYGFAAGADYRVSPDTLLGFALGGAGTSYHLSTGLGSGSSNVFQAGIYGRHTFGPAYVAGSLAYGWQDVTTDRRVMFDQLRARFNAHMFSGRLETGYRFATPFGGLTPYAAGQFTNIALPAYQEQAITGPGVFALSYGSKSVTAWRSELGLRGDKAIEMGDATLTLRSRLAWAHDFNPDRSISASFLNLPASGFIVNGAAQARNAALVSAGAEMKWHNGWSIAGSFEGSFSNRGNGYAGKGSLRYQW